MSLIFIDLYHSNDWEKSETLYHSLNQSGTVLTLIDRDDNNLESIGITRIFHPCEVSPKHPFKIGHFYSGANDRDLDHILITNGLLSLTEIFEMICSENIDDFWHSVAWEMALENINTVIASFKDLKGKFNQHQFLFQGLQIIRENIIYVLNQKKNKPSNYWLGWRW